MHIKAETAIFPAHLMLSLEMVDATYITENCCVPELSAGEDCMMLTSIV